MDWKQDANKAANALGWAAMRAHRGAAPWTPETFVIFENRGGSTADIEAHLKVLRERLTDRGVRELGFSLANWEEELPADDECHQWAMVVELLVDLPRGSTILWLDDLAWEAYEEATGDHRSRRGRKL